MKAELGAYFCSGYCTDFDSCLDRALSSACVTKTQDGFFCPENYFTEGSYRDLLNYFSNEEMCNPSWGIDQESHSPFKKCSTTNNVR